MSLDVDDCQDTSAAAIDLGPDPAQCNATAPKILQAGFLRRQLASSFVTEFASSHELQQREQNLGTLVQIFENANGICPWRFLLLVQGPKRTYQWTCRGFCHLTELYGILGKIME